MARPFIPRDKPKSFVIFICACLIGLLIFGPLAMLGGAFEWRFVYGLGYFGFMGCWLVGVFFLIIFSAGHFSGQYRNLSARDWKDQVW